MEPSQNETMKPIPKDLRGTKLFIGTPSHVGLKTEYVLSLLNLYTLSGYGVQVTEVFFPKSSILHQNRNQIVARFLNSTATHLLMIDDDISYQAEAVLRLLAFDKEFSGLACPIKKTGKDQFAVGMKAGTGCPDTGMWKCENIGTGFMMLKRSAIEK